MTKRKPGAKRGRPSKDFWSDPDRAPVAIAMALRMIGASENAAYLVVSVHILGRKTAEHVTVSDRRKRGVGRIAAGTTETTFERLSFPGQTTTTFAGYASTLRRKADRWLRDDPEAAAWLRTATKLIAAFMRLGCEAGDALQDITQFVCDLAWRAVLKPPDYSPRVLGAAIAYHGRQETASMLGIRDLYPALSNPVLAAPGARPAQGGSPRNLSVIVVEDEIAELIRMDPSALAPAARGQLAAELAKVIADWMETRAA
jgi:hypothetical protein